VKPPAREIVGTAAGWHFRVAAGVFAAVVAGELTGQALHGAAGTGDRGWLAFLVAGGWVVGLVWRERVGVVRAWSCCIWVLVMSLLALRFASRHTLLFGRIEFSGDQALMVAQVPASGPLLVWLVVGGGFLVVEGLWGEWRAGVSTLTALVSAQMALMILPAVASARGDWRRLAGSAPAASPGEASGSFAGLPWADLAAWFILSLVLAFGLVIMGDNWSSAEARSRRQAWAPAAVLLALTVVCLGADLSSGLWLPAAVGAVNAMFFGAVVTWYLRAGGRT